MHNYECINCGKTGVKLWAPIDSVTPKFCAKCAESKQSKMMYNEYVWEKNLRVLHLTGRKLPLPAWKVSKEGLVPSYAGLDAFGKPLSYTTTLIIDLDGLKTSLVPVYPEDEDWKDLPTY